MAGKATFIHSFLGAVFLSGCSIAIAARGGVQATASSDLPTKASGSFAAGFGPGSYTLTLLPVAALYTGGPSTIGTLGAEIGVFPGHYSKYFPIGFRGRIEGGAQFKSGAFYLGANIAPFLPLVVFPKRDRDQSLSLALELRPGYSFGSAATRGFVLGFGLSLDYYYIYGSTYPARKR